LLFPLCRFLIALGSWLLALSRLASFLPTLILYRPTDLFTDEGIEKWATPLPILEHLTQKKCTVWFAAQPSPAAIEAMSSASSAVRPFSTAFSARGDEFWTTCGCVADR